MAKLSAEVWPYRKPSTVESLCKWADKYYGGEGGNMRSSKSIREQLQRDIEDNTDFRHNLPKEAACFVSLGVDPESTRGNKLARVVVSVPDGAILRIEEE